MRRAFLIALLAVVASAACKDDKKQQAAVKAAPDAGTAAATADAGGPSVPLLPPAPPPSTATAEQCKTTAEYAVPTLKLAAEARQVPADKSEAAAKALGAAFDEQCTASAWPTGFLGCLGRSPQELNSYRRCFERLSAAKRTAWNARLDEIVGAAGGTTYPPPAPVGAEGTTFEELCPVFVAEVARFDECAGAMYLPAIEEVLAAARAAQVDGVVPTDKQPALKAMCDERAMVARESASRFCQ